MIRLKHLLSVYALIAVVGNSAAQEPPPPKAEVKYPALLAGKPLREDPKDDKLRKLLKARYDAVLVETRFNYAQELCGRDNPDYRYRSWQRLVRSGLELCDKPAEKVAIRKNYLEMTREAEAIEKNRLEAGRVGIESYERARHERLDAEIQLLRAEREAGISKDK